MVTGPVVQPGRRHARAGTRVLVAGSVGLVAFGAAMAFTAWQAAFMVGWCTMSATVVAWVLVVVWHKDSDATAALARREDDSRTAADVLLVSASIASLAGVGLGLVKGAHTKGVSAALLTVLAVLSIVLAWAVIQVVFTLHYARLFYTEGGGIDFNEDTEPDYRDFAYLALTLGMTYQVSDTDLTRKSVRRTALRHGLLSYLFGTVIVAMTINVVAGLVR